MKIDAHELRELANKFKDTKLLKRAAENALYNASQVVAIGAKQKHIFKSQTFKLENSIFTEVKGLTSEIFTPIDGQLGVPYAGWIDAGSRRTKNGTVTWNSGKGDPYIENSFKRNNRDFFKTMQDDLTEALQDSL
jgi:hypothetical protein